MLFCLLPAKPLCFPKAVSQRHGVESLKQEAVGYSSQQWKTGLKSDTSCEGLPDWWRQGWLSIRRGLDVPALRRLGLGVILRGLQQESQPEGRLVTSAPTATLGQPSSYPHGGMYRDRERDLKEYP